MRHMRGDYQSEHLQCVFVSARRQEPSQRVQWLLCHSGYLCRVLIAQGSTAL